MGVKVFVGVGVSDGVGVLEGVGVTEGVKVHVGGRGVGGLRVLVAVGGIGVQVLVAVLEGVGVDKGVLVGVLVPVAVFSNVGVAVSVSKGSKEVAVGTGSSVSTMDRSIGSPRSRNTSSIICSRKTPMVSIKEEDP